MKTFTLADFFPLIDDPANLFFSKLRNIFTSSPVPSLHTKAIDGVHREIEFSILGLSKKHKWVFDIRELKEQDEGKSLYLALRFIKRVTNLTDTTTVGEQIPVEYISSFISYSYPSFYVEDSKEAYLIKVDVDDVPGKTLLLIRVGTISKTYSNSTRLDIGNADFTSYRATYKGSYRNRVGWRWELTLNSSLDDTQTISFQKFASWKLYCIDSDFRETLIDDSSLPENKANYSYIWATQYGPSVDHPVNLYTFYRIRENVIDFWVVENEFVKGLAKHYKLIYSNFHLTAKMYYETEPFCNTRGFIPEYFEYLFRGLKIITERGEYSQVVTFEERVLIYAYIINMNIRYPYLSFKDDMFKVMDTIDIDSTYTTLSNGLPVEGDNYYPYYMKTLAISGSYPYVSYSPYPGSSNSSYNGPDGNTDISKPDCPPRPASIFSLYAKDPYNAPPISGEFGRNMITWYGNNNPLESTIRTRFSYIYSVSVPPSNLARSFNLPIVQNSLQSRAVSFLRWYQRELVYLITFRRYFSANYKYGRHQYHSHSSLTNNRYSEIPLNFTDTIINPDVVESVIANYYTQSSSPSAVSIQLLFGDIKAHSIMNRMLGCSGTITYNGGDTYEEKPI